MALQSLLTSAALLIAGIALILSLIKSYGEDTLLFVAFIGLLVVLFFNIILFFHTYKQNRGNAKSAEKIVTGEFYKEIRDKEE